MFPKAPEIFQNLFIKNYEKILDKILKIEQNFEGIKKNIKIFFKFYKYFANKIFENSDCNFNFEVITRNF